MRRGEVWWARLKGPAGRRPVLLLSRNEAYGKRTHVTVSPITRTIRRLATEISLTKADGMKEDCVVNLDDLLTIRQIALEEKLTTLSDQKMATVREAIVFALDL
ncbi:MAG: type II toxin-antitoxin system PemK/MazF family toxin [Chloroflexota bacterium]